MACVQSAETMLHELQAGNALTQLPDEASINYHDTKQTVWLINGQHPRTAVGLTKTGAWVFVVVEGRQRDVEGLTLPQFAEFMRTLKCEQALNLGGGGDSTLVFDGQAMNIPSGGSATTFIDGQRPVSDAILVFDKS